MPYIWPWAYISGRQTPGLTGGSPPAFVIKKGGEPRVKTGVWRSEIWALLPVQQLLKPKDEKHEWENYALPWVLQRG
jgi:hypothetical protein